MKIQELKASARSRRVRVGRGVGSGCGKTSGRGHKGQKSRSGGGVRPGFEGGQMPIYRRLPKRGFKNVRRSSYVSFNISKLNIFEDGSEIDAVVLIEAGVIKKVGDGVRILGGGELTRRLTVRASGFTKSAQEKITAVGGTFEVI